MAKFTLQCEGGAKIVAHNVPELGGFKFDVYGKGGVRLGSRESVLPFDDGETAARACARDLDFTSTH